MNSLGETSIFFKKYLLPLALFILVSFLVWLIYLRYQNPKTTPQPTITPPSIKQLTSQKAPNSYKIDAKFPKIPKDLPIYSVQVASLDDQFSSNIAKAFGITSAYNSKDPTYSGIQYFFKQDNLELVVNPLEIRFKDRREPKYGTTTEAELGKLATIYINKLAISQQELSLDPTKTNYLKIAGDEYQGTSKENAQVYIFFFNASIDNFPILGNSQEASLAKVTMTNSSLVTAAKVKYPYSLSQKEPYKLKTGGEAIKELEANQGKIVSATTFDEFGKAGELYNFLPTNISQVIIKNIYIAYFLPDKTDSTLQPIYVFEGEFKSTKNESGAIRILVPAIS